MKKDKERQKKEKEIAHSRFTIPLREWMKLNNLTVKEVSKIVSVPNRTIESWFRNASDARFPTLPGFISLVNRIEKSDTLPVGPHGRRFDYVFMSTGEKFTALENQIREYEQIIQKQKTVIAYLESKIETE